MVCIAKTTIVFNSILVTENQHPYPVPPMWSDNIIIVSINFS